MVCGCSVGRAPTTKRVRYSTAADPTSVVASAAAAERLAQRRQREHRTEAAAAAAAAQAAAMAPETATPQVEEPPPEAFSMLPMPLARFMDDQKFEAPTAVQAKCACGPSMQTPLNFVASCGRAQCLLLLTASPAEPMRAAACRRWNTLTSMQCCGFGVAYRSYVAPINTFT